MYSLRVFFALSAVFVGAGLVVMVVTFHLGIKPVLTGSMCPTYCPGAVVLTERVPVTTLEPGQIVLFVPPGESQDFAHRIETVTGPPNDPIITTKGDANQTPDPWHAQLHSAYVPKVIGTVPWVGRLLVAAQGSVKLLLIVGGALVALVFGLFWILEPKPKRKVGLAA